MSNPYRKPSIDAFYHFGSFSKAFSEEKFKCEKLAVDRRRTSSDGKSWHNLWPGGLINGFQTYISSSLLFTLTNVKIVSLFTFQLFTTCIWFISILLCIQIVISYLLLTLCMLISFIETNNRQLADTYYFHFYLKTLEYICLCGTSDFSVF